MPESAPAMLSAQVLGQLLLMQNVLCNLPDEHSIFSFVCRGLINLPGVTGARHAATANECVDPSERRFPLHAGVSDWGDLIVHLSDPETFSPYEPYVNNFVFMVAVILEERQQRRLVGEHRTQLEQRVQERTRQLTVEIEERRQIEEELRRSRNMLAHTLDSVPQAVFWKDRHGVYLGCNQVFARTVGLDRPEQIVGKTDFDLPWPRGEAEAYRQDDRTVIEHGQPKRHIVEPVQQSNGTRLWVDTTKVPLIDDLGFVYGVLGVFDDITERKQAEAEKERLQAQLTQAQKMESVGRLAGGVAHDFNNMLQAIIGNANMALEEEPASALLKESLVEILKAAQRSAELTHQLLAFARKQTVNPQVLDLNDTVAGILKMLQRLIGEDILLVWRPGPAIWPVWIDPVQIHQVLTNLAVNARDAIRGVGQITIETANQLQSGRSDPFHPDAARGDFVMLTVRDTGCGMNQETKNHLFEPFFTTKPVGQGTGLGLATVYGIVKQNNGTISVLSEPGQGATFVIHLPRCAPTSETVDAVVKERVTGGTETVLLVEDEAQILNLARRILERQGYTVLAARLPEDALQAVAQYPGPIHLIITDVIMPGLNGSELRARVAALKPGVRCLYISGYTAEIITHRGVLEEGVQFLAKPFSNTDLAAKVRQVLDQSSPLAPVGTKV